MKRKSMIEKYKDLILKRLLQRLPPKRSVELIIDLEEVA